MRIAIVYDAVHPWVTGGGERRFHELAVRLAAAGHEVHWYGMRWWDGPSVIERDGVVLHGVCRALPLYTPTGRRSVVQALVFGLACLRLLGARYDVVDCCGFPYFSLFAARLATWLRGGRLVSTWHEVWGPDYWRTYLGRLGIVGAVVERLAAQLPDTVVPVSPQTAGRLTELGVRAPATVVVNGVDHTAVAAAEPAARGYDVVCAGRLCDFKDVELLLDAHALLLAERPGTTLGVVGDGPHREALQARVEALGTGAHVEFTGWLPTESDVHGVLKSSGVLALTSQREGFGIVVVEAHACGVPAVVADHPGNLATALVAPGTGTVCAPQPAAVAAALLAQLAILDDDDARAEVRAAARRNADRYHWDTVAREYADVLQGAK
ncbi:Glycosyltransferase involved in cell wall bisynthesis [Quadrisphaera granulorum]|uniref:Glycosyltransferase involved in cell wall biosynthesis n=1 Tax=Quadrisphaera granulorum TaxID=317664 RepID=A0A316ADC1_9ACTN|nr:glycosyltransferase [Quadrisphaera granulorum]PWJ55733.1 glycosyltransferase involved in cell wall biosynthesis [Quadrisphaera granulorum]SZE95230.1 Glycosyltransferase involved in cell wall bisynthesis [Quadrisphaera granulorum]